MSTTNQQSTQDPLLLFTQHAGDYWRCLLVSVDELGHATIQDSCQVASDYELKALIDSKNPTQINVVLSGADTICRTVTLPDVEEEQIYEVLRLQAEARLLGSTPSHRTVIAPLDSAVGETNRVGLIIAWPKQDEDSIPKCLHGAHFIPDTAALAALLDGHRPTEPLLIADLSTGSVTLALTHANGAAIRATREDHSSNEAFTDGVLRITKETATIHNLSASFTDGLIATLRHTLLMSGSDAPIIILPDVIINAARNDLAGCGDSSEWWQEWGILAGSAIAATGSLRSLTTMEYEAPVINPSMIESIVHKLETRSLSSKLIIAAVLLIAFGPAILSGVRLGMLELMNPNLEAQYKLSLETQQEQIVYKELGKSTWPMAKLIADITNNIPVGIDVETIRLNVGEPVSIRGRALDEDGKTAAELVATFQSNLQSTGVFKDVQFSYDTAGTYGDRDFDLWANVVNPLKRPRYTTEQDFGKWTLAMRKDGTQPQDADSQEYEDETIRDDSHSMMNTANADAIPDNTDPRTFLGDSPTREHAGRPLPPRNGDSGLGSREEDPNATGGSSFRIPETLTPEQIEVMSAEEALIALKDVTEGLNHVGRDDEAKKRLRAEMRLLLDRLKEAQK